MNIAVGTIAINGTLLVQMLNFWIAYLMIRFLLLQPVYRLILEREKAAKKQYDTIKSAEDNIEHKREDRRKLWQACREYFEKQRPAHETVVHIRPEEMPQVSSPTMTEKEAVRLHKDTLTLLRKSVEMADE